MLRSTIAPAFAAVLLFVVASSASAQTMYEPVRYQYGDAMKYYYGGSDPSIHAYADRVACRNGYPSSMSSHGYNSLRQTLGQIGEHRFVFSDCMPHRNAAVFGYTDNDAHNEANSSVPLYYRKSEILAAGHVASDGSLVVPAAARPLAHMAARDTRLAAPSEPKPRAILILPKKAAPKTDTKPVNLVASAK
jgi:hypothetical protein